jgi:hypothetical protein
MGGVAAAAERRVERNSYLSRCSRGPCGDSRASGVKAIKDAPWALAPASGVGANTKELVAAVFYREQTCSAMLIIRDGTTLVALTVNV